MGGYSEDDANAEVQRLADTRDFDMVADIVEAAGAVRAAWEAFRSSPEYPAKGDPLRSIADSRGASVAKMAAAMATVPPDDMAAARRAAHPVLGEFFSTGTPAEVAVVDAVDRLRYAAMTRPQLVRDARIITRGWR